MLHTPINDFKATHNVGSITNIHEEDLEIVDTDKYCYLLTYSFPCQDLSVAGKQKGMKKGSGTRSGLLWEVERLLHECKELPEVLLMENVPQVHSADNLPDFESWCNSLENLGYMNFYQDLNAKNYGVAQNRNRTFMVSIRAENIIYRFPKPFPLEKTMKDYLEDKVDEKYYVNSEKAQILIDKLLDDGILDRQTNKQTVDFSLQNAGLTPISNCICARYDSGVTTRAHEGSCVVERVRESKDE